MQTRYGVIDEDDILVLSRKLSWYLRYGNCPTVKRRDASEAKLDYGVQYERFIGHLFETKGFHVSYHGLKTGVEDGGIDLIARAPRKIRLIQCKRWRQAVNADVVSRLQGGLERFIWGERRGKPTECRISIRGVLATSGDVEPEAEALAKHLGIYVLKHFAYRPYPAIKAQRIIQDGGRFLLPFDSGYDAMRLFPQRGDCFFEDVQEAFENNFYYPSYHREILWRLYQLRRCESGES